tara:strand:+ start:602 stop:1165 length:564 start_codon:yes stop_codon:yes gene_type:complete
MRIISGKFKNKKILLPTDKLTRPLKDIVRESIFNIIEHSNLIKNEILNSNVLDLFSGSGSFGLECLSRGASRVDFCENYLPALHILKKNLNNLNCGSRIELFDKTVLNFIDGSRKNKIKYDIIFMDPPYKENKIKDLLDLIFKKEIFKKNGLIILHRSKKTKDDLPNNFQIIMSRSYGLSKIYFGKF